MYIYNILILQSLICRIAVLYVYILFRKIHKREYYKLSFKHPFLSSTCFHMNRQYQWPNCPRSPRLREEWCCPSGGDNTWHSGLSVLGYRSGEIRCEGNFPSWGSKDHETNSLLEKTSILVGIYFINVSTPLKTNNNIGKFPFFSNRKYIFIHGGFVQPVLFVFGEGGNRWVCWIMITRYY